MRESTERTAAADAAVEEEATKAAAEAAAREEEMRQEGVRAAMEARRLTEEHARAERERATGWVLGSFMTFGTLKEAQQLIVELGLLKKTWEFEISWRGAGGGVASEAAGAYSGYILSPWSPRPSIGRAVFRSLPVCCCFGVVR
jgi:hypothetical protein